MDKFQVGYDRVGCYGTSLRAAPTGTVRQRQEDQPPVGTQPAALPPAHGGSDD